MRPIDADAALKALRKCQTYLYDARDPELKIELSSAEAAINNLPTIQLEERTEKRTETHGVCLDAISRQAAIDAANDWYEGLICGSINGLIKRLNALPTVQPEPSTNCSEIPNSSDTISRQAAIDALSMMQGIVAENGVRKGISMAWQQIEDLPPAQPERKTGKWMPDNRAGGGFWVCSCCKFPSEAFAADVLYKFCPNCGADMRGEKDERTD